ncbi:MAG TPA: hypothetical protein V6C81_31695 [Planktothrix sp.]|jgi:hypothetical protein
MRFDVKQLIVLVAAATSMSAGSAYAAVPTFEGQPLVVLVYDRDCKVWCGQVKPVMKKVKEEFAGKNVEFVDLDTTESVLPDSQKRAKELGIARYVADAQDYVPVVLVFDAKHKLSKQLPGPKSKADYEAAIDKVVAAK